MAKYTQSQVDRIKRSLKIKDLAEAAGMQLARKSGQFVARCPWHEDATPSLFIHPTKNLFNCFGCDAGGDSIQWVMRTKGIGFTEAVALILDQNPHLKEIETDSPSKTETCPLNLDGNDQQFLQQVIEFYHQRLLDDYQAQDYLAKRGILDHEAIKAHKIGFADRELGRAIPDKQLKLGRELRELLTELGIYRKSGHGHFNGSIVFPVIDPAGNIREIYGRKITKGLRKGTAKHLYLAEDCRLFNDRGLWNEQALAVHSEIILCESIIDAMSFWTAGYKNVTAIYGVNGFTDYHLDALNKYRTRTVLLALDRDEEGEAATKRIGQTLTEQNINVYQIKFPQASKDANGYLQTVTSASSESVRQQHINGWMGLVIRNATWIGNGSGSGKPVAIETGPKAAAKEKTLPAELTIESQAEPNQNKQPAATQANKQASAEAAIADSYLAAPAVAGPSKVGPKAPEIPHEIKDNEIAFTLGDRGYRVRGLEKNHSYDTLKINLLARLEDHFHVDTFDLYQSRPRAAFIKLASIELGIDEAIIKRDLGKILLKLEELQQDQIESLLKSSQPAEVEIDPAEKAVAMKLLKDENLLETILADFDACGVVGEETNKLIGYLATISRKLNDPLAVLIQSSSAAGKSSLMDAVLAFVPEEDKVAYSAMTGQSLYYMGGGDLKHKILAISEEEGVRQASYALKLLQSEGSLRIASTGKDPNTGRMETQEYTVEGPVMLFLTTTSYDIDEELQNRCLTLSVCEDRSQTQAIHAIQRKRQTIEGLLSNQDRTTIQTKHQNAQRLLKPLLVANNFAEELKFRSDRTRTRRDHAKYLALIRVIALLHQHQRDIKIVDHHGQQIEYIEATREDIAKADQLAAAVMARSYKELPDKTEQVSWRSSSWSTPLALISKSAPVDYRFTRKAVSQFLLANQMAISATHLKRHLATLEDNEYLIVHSGGGRGRLKTYQLEYEPPSTMQEGHDLGEKSASSPSEDQDFLNVKTSERNGHLQLQS